MKTITLNILVGLLAAALTSGICSAATVTFVTPSGSTTGSNPLSASAAFTTGTNSVTIDLSNLLTAAQMNDASQLLSDIVFTLSGTFATGLVSNSNEATPTGTLIDVGSGGTVTSNAGPVGLWGFSNILNVFHLDDLNGGQSPKQTIIGGTPGSFTAYSNANSSITGGSHSPFLQGTEHFVLTIAGVTTSTQVTAATFSFGTVACGQTGGTCITGSAVPEPRATAAVLFGAVLLAAAYRRRKAVLAQ
jgi:hypothetical protein